MNRPVTLFAAVLAASAGLVLAAPASAQSSETVRVRVPTSDLNLASVDGARTLLARIDQAADEACGGAPDIRLLGQDRAFQSCRRAAVAGGVAQAHSEMVTALARGERAFDEASR
ncbi:MAG: UrcA family protein [Caulobacteraceae bacterium]